MTIDEAIRCAEWMKHDPLKLDFDTNKKVYEFATLCADALRLAKKMSEEAGLTEETEKIMKKKDEIEIENACENLAEKVVNLLFPEENAIHPKRKQERVNAVADAPDTWQERMQREYRETKERAEKLYRVIAKNESGTLDFTLNCPIELLKRQYGHMIDYLYTLEIRAEIEGVNLHEHSKEECSQ